MHHLHAGTTPEHQFVATVVLEAGIFLAVFELDPTTASDPTCFTTTEAQPDDGHHEPGRNESDRSSFSVENPQLSTTETSFDTPFCSIVTP